MLSSFDRMTEGVIHNPPLFSSNVFLVSLCFRCAPGFFQSVCSCLLLKSREEVHQLVSLLQLLNFNLLLTGELNWETCSSVGRVLSLCGIKVDLILTDTKMSARDAAVLFRSTTQLRSLRQEPEEQRLSLTTYLLSC